MKIQPYSAYSRGAAGHGADDGCAALPASVWSAFDFAVRSPGTPGYVDVFSRIGDRAQACAFDQGLVHAQVRSDIGAMDFAMHRASSSTAPRSAFDFVDAGTMSNAGAFDFAR